MGSFLSHQYIAACKPKDSYTKEFTRALHRCLTELNAFKIQLNYLMLYDYTVNLNWLDPFTRKSLLMQIEKLLSFQRNLTIVGFENALMFHAAEAIRLLISLAMGVGDTVKELYLWYFFRTTSCPLEGHIFTDTELAPYLDEDTIKTNAEKEMVKIEIINKELFLAKVNAETNHNVKTINLESPRGKLRRVKRSAEVVCTVTKPMSKEGKQVQIKHIRRKDGNIGVTGHKLALDVYHPDRTAIKSKGKTRQEQINKKEIVGTLNKEENEIQQNILEEEIKTDVCVEESISEKIETDEVEVIFQKTNRGGESEVVKNDTEESGDESGTSSRWSADVSTNEAVPTEKTDDMGSFEGQELDDNAINLPVFKANESLIFWAQTTILDLLEVKWNQQKETIVPNYELIDNPEKHISENERTSEIEMAIDVLDIGISDTVNPTILITDSSIISATSSDIYFQNNTEDSTTYQSPSERMSLEQLEYEMSEPVSSDMISKPPSVTEISLNSSYSTDTKDKSLSKKAVKMSSTDSDDKKTKKRNSGPELKSKRTSSAVPFTKENQSGSSTKHKSKEEKHRKLSKEIKHSTDSNKERVEAGKERKRKRSLQTDENRSTQGTANGGVVYDNDEQSNGTEEEPLKSSLVDELHGDYPLQGTTSKDLNVEYDTFSEVEPQVLEESSHKYLDIEIQEENGIYSENEPLDNKESKIETEQNDYEASSAESEKYEPKVELYLESTETNHKDLFIEVETNLPIQKDNGPDEKDYVLEEEHKKDSIYEKKTEIFDKTSISLEVDKSKETTIEVSNLEQLSSSIQGEETNVKEDDHSQLPSSIENLSTDEEYQGTIPIDTEDGMEIHAEGHSSEPLFVYADENKNKLTEPSKTKKDSINTERSSSSRVKISQSLPSQDSPSQKISNILRPSVIEVVAPLSAKSLSMSLVKSPMSPKKVSPIKLQSTSSSKENWNGEADNYKMDSEIPSKLNPEPSKTKRESINTDTTSGSKVKISQKLSIQSLTSQDSSLKKISKTGLRPSETEVVEPLSAKSLSLSSVKSPMSSKKLSPIKLQSTSSSKENWNGEAENYKMDPERSSKLNPEPSKTKRESINTDTTSGSKIKLSQKLSIQSLTSQDLPSEIEEVEPAKSLSLSLVKSPLSSKTLPPIKLQSTSSKENFISEADNYKIHPEHPPKLEKSSFYTHTLPLPDILTRLQGSSTKLASDLSRSIASPKTSASKIITRSVELCPCRLDPNKKGVCPLCMAGSLYDLTDQSMDPEVLKKDIYHTLYFTFKGKTKFLLDDPKGILQDCYDFLLERHYSKIKKTDLRMLYKIALAGMTNLTRLSMNYGYIADGTGEALLSIGSIREGKLKDLELLCIRNEVPSVPSEVGSPESKHKIPDIAWQKARVLCPKLGVHLVMISIARYNLNNLFIAKTLPLRSIHISTGYRGVKAGEFKLWYFDCMLKLIGTYHQTLVSLSFYTWHTRERLDSFLMKLLKRLVNLEVFVYYGTLQYLRTLDEICCYYRDNKTNMKVLKIFKISDPCKTTSIEMDLIERENNYRPAFNEKGIDFSIGTYTL